MKTKTIPVSKAAVWKAYQQVKANRGSAGIDEVSIEKYETKLSSNLYQLWNRLSSGSYFPKPVKSVSIPKGDGGERMLGIPTVEDRIAQMVVRNHIEPQIEKEFDEHSYGYRPGKSAHEAIAQARKNCWKYPFTIDLDIQGFFDNIDHELMMKALNRHTQEKWVLMYIARWLKAPIVIKGETVQREKGTPQGGVISPLLANLYLHYAFDKWMRKECPVEFERYADDIIIHCKTQQEAEHILSRVKARLLECKLTIHPTKTKIVYCQNNYERTKNISLCRKFTFLGYTFKPRITKTKSGNFTIGFNPAVSKEALNKISREIRKMRISRNSSKRIEELAKLINPKVRGWLNYYGKFRKSSMNWIMFRLNRKILKWATNRHKKLRRSFKRAYIWLIAINRQKPDLFAHWSFGVKFQ
jgi:RNA-directed DNA polymerase